MQEPVLIDLDAATTAVRPYVWLIDRVGDDGIKLTAAGYLPPVHVEAAFTELDLADAWIGMGNREQLTIPVLHLRESAQRMGLLRKHRGRLMVTARGKAARSDPLALWFQLAERMPLTSKDLCEEQAGFSSSSRSRPVRTTPTGSSPTCSTPSAGGTAAVRRSRGRRRRT
jgi:hypothetical protein